MYDFLIKLLSLKTEKEISILLGAGFSANKGYPIGDKLNQLLLNCNLNTIGFATDGRLMISRDGTKPTVGYKTSYGSDLNRYIRNDYRILSPACLYLNSNVSLFLVFLKVNLPCKVDWINPIKLKRLFILFQLQFFSIKHSIGIVVNPFT